MKALLTTGSQDTVLLVAWKNGLPELRYSLKREFAKGLHDKPGQR